MATDDGLSLCALVPPSTQQTPRLLPASEYKHIFFPTAGIKLARGTHVCARVHTRVHALRVKPGPITPAGRCAVSVPEQNKRKQDTQTMGDKSLTFLGPALCRGVPRGPPCTCGFRVKDSAGVSQDLCSESHQYLSASKHKAQDVPGGKNSTPFVSDCLFD